ncbi:hypothetical protein Adeg_0816 [Ammonifex degensii KC4]|uniref:Uncharacterized protein n=1 Tax=Ammonifex degensii (strain DSM 10501 / KC4) TaxID=429009 RepID=C9RCI1_AMMDK|nr:hypothetical protein [Ammonifex degensii]ACX51958.1 hypothetical protein Adeg_0816 [Ammonifex degensii KC4]
MKKLVLGKGRKRLELTGRDVEFLRMLAGVGVFSLEHAQKFYGSQKYYLRRIEKFARWKLVKRRDRCIWPTSFLVKLLEGGGHIALVPARRRQALFSIADLCLALGTGSGVEVLYRKHLEGVRKKYLAAVLRKDGREYGVFLLEGRSRFAVGRVFDGLKELGIPRAVVLCLSREGMEEFSRLAEVFCRRLGLEELLLLPADRGPSVLAGALSPGFEGLLGEAFPGIERVAPWVYRWEGREVVVLAANDLVSRWRLLEGGWMGKVLVCLSGQRRFFSALFPGAELACLRDDFSGWAEFPSGVESAGS